jgi:hypothetical protein
VEVCLNQGSVDDGSGGRVCVRSTSVAENGGVDATGEASGTDVGVGTDPVVADGLVGIEDDRVTLTGEDLEAIDGKRSVVDTIDFDDGLCDICVSKSTKMNVP